MKRAITSLVWSLIASVVGTYLLRRLLSTDGNHSADKGPGTVRTVVVVVPILAGNSANRLVDIKTAPFSKVDSRRRRSRWQHS